MLTTDEVLNLNYYRKTSFTGWMNGMRFLIRREESHDNHEIFHAWVWPGPYIFDLTDDSLKSDTTAPFSNEGQQQIVDWINQQYEEHPQRWNHDHKILIPASEDSSSLQNEKAMQVKQK